MQSGVVAEKNWTLSVDQCRLQALQCSVHLDLLSVFLRCNGFTGIQKALMDQMGSRAANSNRDTFSDASLALGSAVELFLGPATELVTASCHIKSIFFVTHHNPIEKWFIVVAWNKRRQHFKMMSFFLFLVSL